MVVVLRTVVDINGWCVGLLLLFGCGAWLLCFFGCCWLVRGVFRGPSSSPLGQTQAIRVEIPRANKAANSRMLAGLDCQNQVSPARAENRVRKSDTDT